MDDLRREKADLEIEEAVERTTLERVEELGRQQGRIFEEYQNDKRRWAVVAFLGFLAMIGFAWAAVAGYQDDQKQTETSDRLAQAVNDIEEQRSTARLSSCNQAVDFATAHNELVSRTQDLLLTVAATSNNPATDAFVAEQVALYEANIVRVRDCSPEGLQAFADGTGGYLP